MDVETVVTQAKDAMTVRRVFGEPYEKNGVIVIPAAKIRGGAGGGEGPESEGKPLGRGQGFGLNARPVGAYVIRDGDVSWQPALDLNRIILGGQVIAVVGMLVFRSLAKKRYRLKRLKIRKR